MGRGLSRLLPVLQQNRVIAGVRQPQDIQVAVDKGIKVFFFLGGTILQLREMVPRAKAPGDTMAFIHIDLVQGVGKDAAGVTFLARELPVDGIVTTRIQLIRAAKEERLWAIQRLFALDSEAVKTGLSVLRSAQPDAVEILPALVLPYLKHRLPVTAMPPIIAGGLVETVEELAAVLHSPAVAVSTSRKELWGYEGLLA